MKHKDRLDYLYATPFFIRQNRNMYHFSSDSELLGRFIRPEEADRVLDIGTNNGVLLLYASMHRPQLLCGIDLFEEVIELARENLERNQVRAELYACPLQEFEHEPFSLVISNPPFFTSSRNDLKSANPYRRAARFTDTLSVQDLFFHARRLLTKQGRVCVIYPDQLFQEARREAEANGFSLLRLQNVLDQRGGVLKRRLMEFVRSDAAETIIEPDLYLDTMHEKTAAEQEGNLPGPQCLEKSAETAENKRICR
jgi:tRNA1(Val) A37 N6-methylase TrmN6